MRSVNIRYFPAIDHLRAYAALLIVVYHGLALFDHFLRFGVPFRFGFPIRFDFVPMALIVEGHTAVALFMVLSGFVLTYGALEHRVEYWPFMRNRFLRTYPLLLLLLFVGIATWPARFTLQSFAQSVLGFANVAGALDVPPFSTMFWTVAVEWQFYVVFPFLLVFMKTGWTRQLLGFVALLLVLRGFAVLAGGNARDLSYVTIVGRLDQFLLGMWAAWLFSRHTVSQRMAIGLTLGGLTLVIVTLFVFNRAGGWFLEAPWKIAWPTFEGVLWVVFVIGYISWADRAAGLWSRVLIGIGTISYSMYLVHFIVLETMVKHAWLMRFTGSAVADALLNTVLFALPVTLIVSTLTYHFVELPFLRLRGHYHRDARASET